MPNQTAPYLKWLNDNGPFESYVEIGSRYGGTFMLTCEALKAKNKSIKALACDVIELPIDLKLYLKINNYEYLHGSSMSDIFIKKIKENHWSICLIDGSHKYEDVLNDYLNVKDNFDVLVFHDIVSDVCPGVVKIWKELKNKNIGKYYEFTDQYFQDKSYMGIGVIDLRK